ncbi:MAG TPA: biopolymer transporter ExbD [Deltaproteobacteria bacterium]|nr:biopolymer transporter ExbD [Deltaproteobacteria bacterium]|tara:strand:+ start:133 stop:591 length:459 start_codon:yes stop_codon:yes gene_type:complete
MGSRLGGEDDDAITDINITPFVDIILVVLIIFMVTTTTIVERSIKVELPDAATGEAVSKDVSVAIQMLADRTLTLDGAAITWEALRSYIRSERSKTKADGAELICLIGADKNVPHGEVVKIIDLVRQEGVTKFAINIQPVPRPDAAPPEPSL